MSHSTRQQQSHDTDRTHTPTGLIALAWTLVGVPLAYGLFQTVKTATALFTGG